MISLIVSCARSSSVQYSSSLSPNSFSAALATAGWSSLGTSRISMMSHAAGRVSVLDEARIAAPIELRRRPARAAMESCASVPKDDQPAVAKAAEKLFGLSDDEYCTLEERAQDTINEIMLLNSTGQELAKFRRNNPGDDLMTSIVNAEVDGHRLSDEEIGAFLILLASAGNDTTKQATTHAMMALVANPSQRAC